MLKEVLKGVAKAELLVSISQNPDIYDRKHVATRFLQILRRTSHNNDELLLCLRPQLQRYALRQLLRDRVFNVPRLMFDLTVDYGLTLFLHANGNLGYGR